MYMLHGAEGAEVGKAISCLLLLQGLDPESHLEAALDAVEGIDYLGDCLYAEEWQLFEYCLPVDLVVMEVRQSSEQLLGHLAAWCETHPETKFLLLPEYADSAYLARLLQSGAGVVLAQDVLEGLPIDSSAIALCRLIKLLG